MDSIEGKDPHWKGQSRILKVCHWCAKKQDPDGKPFQACSKCKEVIYCCKDCQVASWPLHKGPCKMSATAKARTVENPALAQSIGNFKKWHGSNLNLFQHAVICALDLAHKPNNVDNEVLYVGCQLHFNHADLPPNRKYTVRGGFVMTMDETREVLQKNGGADILESGIAASNHMRKKGGLGVATMLLKAHDIVDVVKVILPSLDVAQRIHAEDDWGKDWPLKLKEALDMPQ